MLPRPLPAGIEPRVSVVIPCYNYARYLEDSVGSVLAQEGVDLDVVILDDASSDDSVAVAERIATRDPRVRLVRHARNLGHVETANEALGLATGEFVVKLDADDLLTPGSLARSTALLTAYPSAVLCYGYPQEFRGTPPADVPTSVSGWTIWEGRDWIERVLRRGHNVIMQPEVVVRRTAVVESGGYRPQLRWAEDYNWWLRLATMGAIGRVDGATQGLYRVHDKSFQRSADDIELSDLEARVAAVTMFFEECGPRLRDHGKLHAVALSSLARDARRLGARAAERPSGGADAAAKFSEVARDLERAPGVGRRTTLSSSPTVLGRHYRQLEDRLRWRRWRRHGI
ncbi:glycosyltransferase family 2 protein [Agromyces intestinalis]|nr:glycosyltransferase family A protein [Agromyces intestinalis]